MPHKSAKKSYPASPGHPGKKAVKMPMHKMPNGKMMADKAMK